MEGWSSGGFKSGAAPVRTHYFNRYGPASNASSSGVAGGARAPGCGNHQAGGDYVIRPSSAAPMYTPYNQQFGASHYG